MKSLQQLCEPRSSVFDSQRRDTVLDLTDLVNDRVKPEEFFEENFITDGMKVLLEQGFRRLEGKSSQGVFKVNPGSLLVALQRLERAGLVDAEWRQTPNARRARIYSLTRAGRKQLDVETTDWTRRAAAIARLLKAEA